MWDSLKSAFASSFPGPGQPVCLRAPGRVNLIGEHTDYNGLPVLPMTISREIRVAAGPRADNRIVLRNMDPSFPPLSFDNAPCIIPSCAGSWDNYVKAAVSALNNFSEPPRHAGMNLLFDADLPPGAGLSSSSALVVLSGLAYLEVTGRPVEGAAARLQFAERMADAEHFVGTRGGGMDQAAIMCGSTGHACKIDFFPLRVQAAPLPSDCAVMVCNSMVRVEKSGAARAMYNTNPRLCALACELVRVQLRRDIGEEVPLARLGDLWYGPLCMTTREVEDLFRRAVPRARMSLAQIARLLDCAPADVARKWLDGTTVGGEEVDLLPRLMHQTSEFRRVENARDALIADDPAALGVLMNDSHLSCRNNLRISTPEMDLLVDTALRAGALGARLTGAGFGGATVNLVWRDQMESFRDSVVRHYYREHLGWTGEAPVFEAVTSPGAGKITAA